MTVSSGGDGQFRTLEEALKAHYDSKATEARAIVLKSGSYQLPPDMVLHTPIEIRGQGDVTLNGSGTGVFQVRRAGIKLSEIGRAHV